MFPQCSRKASKSSHSSDRHVPAIGLESLKTRSQSSWLGPHAVKVATDRAAALAKVGRLFSFIGFEFVKNCGDCTFVFGLPSSLLNVQFRGVPYKVEL